MSGVQALYGAFSSVEESSTSSFGNVLYGPASGGPVEVDGGAVAHYGGFVDGGSQGH
jgi:hypothetical protein